MNTATVANFNVRSVTLWLILLVSSCVSGVVFAETAQTHNTVSLADTYNVVDPDVTMTISGSLSSSNTNNRVYGLTFLSKQGGTGTAPDNFIVEDIYYTPTNRRSGADPATDPEASLSSFTSTSSNSFTAQFTVPADTFATLVVPSSSFKINGGNNVAAHWSNIVDFFDQNLPSEQADITADILYQAGLKNVDVVNQGAYQDTFADASSLSDVTAIQTVIDSVNASVDAIATVAAAAADGDASEITIADLDAIIGLSGVIDNYLSAYQAAIAGAGAGSLSNATAIQTLITNTNTNTAISDAIPSGCDSDEDCTSIAVTTTVAGETVSIRLFSGTDYGLSGINVNFDTGRGGSCSLVSAIEGDDGASLGTVVDEDASGNDVSAIVDISATEAGYVTLSCEYTTVGSYTIVVNGSFDGYGWQTVSAANVGAANVAAITAVNQWSSGITSLQGAFKGHSALISVPSLPSGVTNTASMFEGATGFNQDIGDWDTGAVADMSSMFKGATAFNQDIGDWDTGVVEDMSSMFDGATAFNQDISQWDISSVTGTGMNDMFNSAELSVNHYDALITSWNTQLQAEGKSLLDLNFNGGTSKFCEAADPVVSDGDQDCYPRITRVTLAVGDDISTLALTVTFSEPVFANYNGTGALEADDFNVTISDSLGANGATLANGTPTSISQNGNSYTLGVTIDGTLQDDQIITVLPAAADSIYDAGGNEASNS